MFKTVKMVLLVLLLGAALFAGYRLRQSFSESGEIITPNRTVSIHTTVREVFPAAEFISLHYRYASIIKDVNSKEMFGIPIPGTEKKLLAIINGTIKLGIQCNEIRIDTTRFDTLFIKFPPIKIISHELHPETAEVYDQRDGIFNKYRASDQFSLEAKQKLETELNVRGNMGIILQARSATEYAFRSFLRAIPALDTIPIVFRWN